MNAIVTGVNGFLGSKLAEKLVADGHTVLRFPRELYFEVEELDRIITEFAPDVVYHCGAYGNHSWQQEDDEILTANVFCTFVLASRVRELRPKCKFVFISTSSVYGRNPKDPKPYSTPQKDKLKRIVTTKPRKETDFCVPETMYAATKLSAELILQQIFPKNLTIIRPFSIYGPGEDIKRLIPKACLNIKAKVMWELVPDPHHDWVFIDDVTAILSSLVTAGSDRDGVWNVGTGKQYSNKQVVDTLETVTGEKCMYHFTDLNRKLFDTVDWVADTRKMRDAGGFQTSFLMH